MCFAVQLVLSNICLVLLDLQLRGIGAAAAPSRHGDVVAEVLRAKRAMRQQIAYMSEEAISGSGVVPYDVPSREHTTVRDLSEALGCFQHLTLS